MMNSENQSKKAIKILFLCWGFSIHAKRRIQIFVDDPGFDVAIASTHNYNFPKAHNIFLDSSTLLMHVGRNVISFRKCRGILSGIVLMRNIFFRLISFFIRLVALIRIQIKVYPNIILSVQRYRRLKREICMGINDYFILKSAVNRFSPDIIFLQTLLYPCYLVYFLPRLPKMAITFWNGDVIWWAKWNGFDRLLKKRIVGYGSRCADIITVNSTMAYNACLDYGVKKEKIHLIRYPGVDLSLFKPIPKDFTRQSLRINSKRIVLWPRGLGEYLNSDILIQAAVKVKKKYPDVLFVVLSGIGGEIELVKHRKMADKVGVSNNFLWKGQVLHDEMPLFYCCSDMVVSISSNDSLPNVMLEAMACGVPLIMSDIPQIREWIKDGDNGFLIPPRDERSLSERIISIFESDKVLVDSFRNKNLRIVRERANSVIQGQRIKDLVRSQFM